MSGISRATGKVLTRREHIAQSINDILTTPIRTRLMRRNYGSYLPQLVDHPATAANRTHWGGLASSAATNSGPSSSAVA